MNDATTHLGSCMCGNIQFSFAGEPRFVSDCVCESCRLAHGATVVSWVGVKSEQFSLDTGKEYLKWYQSSPEAERGFCLHCGTRILFRSSKWPGETHMALACIRQPHELTSSGIYCAGELPPWTHVILPDDPGNG